MLQLNEAKEELKQLKQRENYREEHSCALLEKVEMENVELVRAVVSQSVFAFNSQESCSQ